MGVEDLFGMRPHRLDDVGAVGNVRYEMPVHHVEMNPVGAGCIDRANLFAQFGEIRRQDRRRNDKGTRREGLRHGRFRMFGPLRVTWDKRLGEGKFCRRGINCRARDATTRQKTLV